ncbi:MAG TPA: high-affinity branched-chain amino acid ABC transporter ATP-binding protein LivG [Firmicutes bacterium]|nr:ABC transporter ATP-binding protein [Bacillota bacterium]HAA37314.1 high-affinity branched-chain amino acid ABC transporter ATP-binding protein LivG [Bacillota bacterium]
MPVLKTTDLTMRFGGLTAVLDLNLQIEQGELVGLIGPNGAGKTTVFNMLTGVYRPSEGQIYFCDELLCSAQQSLLASSIAKKGISRTFQNIRLFKDLSVLENVKTAYHQHVNYGFLAAITHFGKFVAEEREIEEKALNFLELFGLEDRRDELAKNLPYGEQRRLEIARALATEPKLLLLDEPAAGMNPQETQQLMELIQFIREKFALTILLIEHDMSLVMGVCERIYVLDYGKIIAEGTPVEIRTNPKVIEAYLGGDK